jgi:hypothetical protein
MKIWYEIGQINSDGGTETVFSSNTLAHCLREFKTKGYNTSHWFIDIWEAVGDGLGYPVGNVDLQSIKWEKL